MCRAPVILHSSWTIVKMVANTTPVYDDLEPLSCQAPYVRISGAFPQVLEVSDVLQAGW